MIELRLIGNSVFLYHTLLLLDPVGGLPDQVAGVAEAVLISVTELRVYHEERFEYLGLEDL